MTRNGGGDGRGTRRPRLPTWVLVLLIAGILGAAGALFVFGDGSSRTSATRTTRTGTASSASSQDELVVPDQSTTSSSTDSAHDTRRRGTIGRQRLEPGADGVTTTDTGGTTGTATTDSAGGADSASTGGLTTRLAGVRIALFAADAGPRSTRTAARVGSIGGVRTPCAMSPRSIPSREAEATLLARTSVALRARGATVDRVDSDAGTAPCAADRVRRFEHADVALVVEVVPRADLAASVTAGRRAGRPTTVEQARSLALLTELTNGLGASGSPRTTATVLASRGVIDLPGGGSSVLVRLPSAALASIGPERLAEVLAGAVAHALAPMPASAPSTAPR